MFGSQRKGMDDWQAGDKRWFGRGWSLSIRNSLDDKSQPWVRYSTLARPKDGGQYSYVMSGHRKCNHTDRKKRASEGRSILCTRIEHDNHSAEASCDGGQSGEDQVRAGHQQSFESNYTSARSFSPQVLTCRRSQLDCSRGVDSYVPGQ